MKIKKHVVNECLNLLEDARTLVDEHLQHDVFLRQTAADELEQLDSFLVKISNHLERAKDGRRKPSKRNAETWRQATAFAG